MPSYPFRKFVVIPGHRDAEVGHPIASKEEENYAHLDLIAGSMKKNAGIDIQNDPDAIPDETVIGWLLGDARDLILVFQAESLGARLKVQALETLTRWASIDYAITTKGR
jgi:hypothetical protein